MRLFSSSGVKGGQVPLVLEHARWMILELLRQPSYVVSTVSIPAIFYIVFALPESRDVASSNLLLASFSCFSVFGVIFLQFGVGVAQERTTSWYYYLKTLPIGGLDLLLARFLSALFFSILSASVLVILALLFTKAAMSPTEWLLFVSFLLIGGISFCPMGLALGYWTTERSSMPVGNMIYLPLSFVGGLWKPPSLLPDLIKDISELLPTRHYGELLWSIVRGDGVPSKNLMILVVYTLLFSVISFVGYRKDYLAKVK